ncbi:MAG TPA: hypothetical protein VN820_06355 [Acidimicrobiales bacterium]|nr:hypothetical protein [Acidimicrobiales bacterium]
MAVHTIRTSESIGTLAGYRFVIVCACGEVIREGPHRSEEVVTELAMSQWRFHAHGSS